MAKRNLSKPAVNGPGDMIGTCLSNIFSKIFGVGIFAVMGFAFSVSPTSNPQLVANYSNAPVIEMANLTYQSNVPVISGSINQLFAAPSFVGPTSAQKRNRLRPQTDILEFVGVFASQRVEIAALRAQPVAPLTRNFVQRHTIDEATRISLASIDPALASAALKAIERATPIDPSIPVPIVASTQLAYVRAETPTTERAVSQYAERDLWCLATAVYFEARGESYRGQVGVAQVVMNRVKSRSFPSTICGVVYQNKSWRNRCQFSFACDGVPDRVREPDAWDVAEEVAQKVTSGELYLPEVANAINYHANYVSPAWAPRMKRLTQIGVHIFYRFRS